LRVVQMSFNPEAFQGVSSRAPGLPYTDYSSQH
jgi:hypothetical protein